MRCWFLSPQTDASRAPGSRTPAPMPPVQRGLECLEQLQPVQRFADIGHGPGLERTQAHLQIIARRHDHGREPAARCR